MGNCNWWHDFSWYWKGVIMALIALTYMQSCIILNLRNDVNENRRILSDMGMKRNTENTIIELQDMDVALVVRADSQLQMYIPEPKDSQDDLPGDVIVVAMAGVLIGNSDPEFFELINRKLEEYQSQTDKDKVKRPI